MAGFTRRQAIARGAAAAATVGGARLTRAADDQRVTIPGPRNEPLERENPDLLVPPSTDAGLMPKPRVLVGAHIPMRKQRVVRY
jgi:hypothetical protein